jgi:hypothetical protein
MSLIGAWGYTFQDGVGAPYVASGVQVMANLNQIKSVVDGNIESDNIKATSSVMCTNRAKTVTAVLTFAANPVFSALAIPDSALSANVALKNAGNVMSGNNTFSGVNTFDQPIGGLKPPTLGAHPSTAGDDGKVYICSGTLYIYKHGTGPVQLDYNGTYAGGAVKSYCGEITIDDGSPAIFMVKTDAIITSAKLKLTAFTFPTYPYTELPAHTHGVGSFALSSGVVAGLNHVHNVVIGMHTHTGSFGSSAHTHAGPNHRHWVSNSSTSGAASATNHTHGVSGNTGYTGIQEGSDPVSNHYHAVSLTTAANGVAHTHSVSVEGWSNYEGTGATGAPSATASVGSTDLGTIASANPTAGWAPYVGTAIGGSSASAGISGGALNDTQKVDVDDLIQVYISTNPTSWGTAKDKGTGGWASLANILASAGGTSEIDIGSYLAVSSFNYIKIVEPTAKKGGRIAYHVEIT